MDTLLLGSCMLLHLGKAKGVTKMSPSVLSKFIKNLLEKSCKHDVVQQNEEVHQEEERRRNEEEWRQKDEEWKL